MKSKKQKIKGLEIVTEESDDISQITINLTYDEWDKKPKQR